MQPYGWSPGNPQTALKNDSIASVVPGESPCSFKKPFYGFTMLHWLLGNLETGLKSDSMASLFPRDSADSFRKRFYGFTGRQ